jgi:CheY-like chemotaxis protein
MAGAHLAKRVVNRDDSLALSAARNQIAEMGLVTRSHVSAASLEPARAGTGKNVRGPPSYRIASLTAHVCMRTMGGMETTTVSGTSGPSPTETTILVVDDEPAVRQMVAMALSREGFRAEQAAAGAQALEILTHASSPIALVVSDLRMPNMTGLELAAHLDALSPDLPIIILSGDSELRPGEMAVGGRQLPFVPKPLDIAHFIATVYRVLDDVAADVVRRVSRHSILSEQTYPYRAFLAAVAENVEGTAPWCHAHAALLVLLYVDAWVSNRIDERELMEQREGASRAVDYDAAAAKTARSTGGDWSTPHGLNEHLRGVLDAIDRGPTADFRYVAASIIAYADALHTASLDALAAEVFSAVICGCTSGTRDKATREHLPTVALRLGACRRKLADFDGALAAYAAANVFGVRMGAPEIVLTARLGQALVVFDRGDLPEAERRIEAIITDAVSYQFVNVRARAWHDRAVVAYHRGRPIDAALFAFEAWNLRPVDERLARDRILVDLATFLHAGGFHDVARRANNLIAMAASEPIVRWHATVNLIDLAIEAGDEPEFERLRQSLTGVPLTPLIEGEYLLRLAQGYLAFGRPAVMHTLERARALAEAHGLNELAHRIEEMLRKAKDALTGSPRATSATRGRRPTRAARTLPAGIRRVAEALNTMEQLVASVQDQATAGPAATS